MERDSEPTTCGPIVSGTPPLLQEEIRQCGGCKNSSGQTGQYGGMYVVIITTTVHRGTQMETNKGLLSKHIKVRVSAKLKKKVERAARLEDRKEGEWVRR